MKKRVGKAGPISWLRSPVPKSFAADVRKLHAECRERLGYVRNFLKLPFAPGRLALYQRYLDRLMRSDDAYLPGIERELLALVASVENRCEPCVNAHAAALRKHGMDGVKVDEITISWRRAGLSARHRALADFAWKLTVRPAEADETWIGALRAAGLSEEQIFEAAQIVGIYNSNNRINNVIGLHLDR
jgi:uncharacterized peroxidase-related enzyme